MVDLASNVNMHATFVAAGPGIRKQGPVRRRPRGRPGADDRLPDGHPRPDQRPRQDPVRPVPRPRASTRKPRSSRSATTTASSIPLSRGRRQRVGAASTRPSPSAARPTSSRGSTSTAEARTATDGTTHRGRRRLGRRHAAHLQLLRRHADDRDHEHDGLSARTRWATTTSTTAQTYLRTDADPAGQLSRTCRPTSSTRRPASRRRVEAVAGLQLRRLQARRRRLHARPSCRR